MPVARHPGPLHPFWMQLTPAQREQLAEKCGTKASWLKLVALGHKPIGAVLARRLHEETCGLVRKEELRPDVYG
jgi:hypothetical protein